MDELRKFYKQYYYASNMRLVVIGAYTLDVLQKHVIESFSNIPEKQQQQQGEQQQQQQGGEEEEKKTMEQESSLSTTKYSWSDEYVSPMKDNGAPFTKETSLQKIYCIAPVSDRHVLSITYPIPSQFENWKSKPCDYIAHLIGHEAEGSILASLKSKSWATACYAGVGAEGFEVRTVSPFFLFFLPPFKKKKMPGLIFVFEIFFRLTKIFCCLVNFSLLSKKCVSYYLY